MIDHIIVEKLHTSVYKLIFVISNKMKEAITNQIFSKFISNSTWLENADEQNYFAVEISDTTKNFCVGIVDIANSTKITAKLPPSKTASYYEFFLNHMTTILNKFGVTLIKNIGDSILFCLQESNIPEKTDSLSTFLECILTMAETHDLLQEKYQSEGLPTIDYRISADYGNLSIMKFNSSSVDLIGTPLNICSKINSQAPVNGIAIGGDLHEVVKDFDEYYCKESVSFSIGLKNSYPIYSLRRKHTC